MIDKFDLYDLLSILIPGTMFTVGLFYFFPSIFYAFSPINNSLIKFTLFIVLSFVSGHVLNAIKSSRPWKELFDPTQRPSEYVFLKGLGDRVLSLSHAELIKKKIISRKRKNFKNLLLEQRVFSSNESIFHLAMQLADENPTQKLLKLYAHYEFYRVMNVAFAAYGLMFFLSFFSFQKSYSLTEIPLIITGLMFVFGSFQSMANSRAKYWVREVLLIAERKIDTEK